jgi:hypothetical protein
VLSEEGVRSAPDDHETAEQSPDVFPACAGSLSIAAALCHVPPRTPLPKAANIRSVHTDAATHVHVRGSSGSASGLAVARTVESVNSVLCIDLYLPYLPSCPPSLGAGLLSALLRPCPSSNLRSLFVFSVCRLVSRRCHPIGSLARASRTVRYCEGSDS